MTLEEAYAMFGTTQGAFNNFYYVKNDPLYKQCIKDAVEYFEPMGIKVGTTHTRIMLTKEQKERVLSFLKNRKKYYDENGLIMR